MSEEKTNEPVKQEGEFKIKKKKLLKIVKILVAKWKLHNKVSL